jgi:hypothetical protein
MPDVAGVRALCPVKITSEEWACCGTKGITILLTAFCPRLAFQSEPAHGFPPFILVKKVV